MNGPWVHFDWTCIAGLAGEVGWTPSVVNLATYCRVTVWREGTTLTLLVSSVDRHKDLIIDLPLAEVEARIRLAAADQLQPVADHR